MQQHKVAIHPALCSFMGKTDGLRFDLALDLDVGRTLVPIDACPSNLSHQRDAFEELLPGRQCSRQIASCCHQVAASARIHECFDFHTGFQVLNSQQVKQRTCTREHYGSIGHTRSGFQKNLACTRRHDTRKGPTGNRHGAFISATAEQDAVCRYDTSHSRNTKVHFAFSRYKPHRGIRNVVDPAFYEGGYRYASHCIVLA